MCGRRCASRRRQCEPAHHHKDVFRHHRCADSCGDALPDLLDGVHRAQAGQGDPELDPGLVPVARYLRQLPQRDQLSVLLERRRQQPHGRPLRGRDLHCARIPRSGLGGALRFPWPDGIRRHGHRRADGAAQRIGDPHVPLARQGRAGGHAAGCYCLLPCDRSPVHGLDAARIRRQCTGRSRRSGDGRRREPCWSISAHRVSARCARSGGHRDLRIHPGVERIHNRLRPPEQLIEADTHHLARVLHHPARHRLGWAHGGGNPDRSSGRGLLPSGPATRGRGVDRGSGQRLIVDSIERLADRCLLPGFTGTVAPDWVLRRTAAGLGGVCLYARNFESPEQLAALTASLHGERAQLIIAIDEEGGDVTRLEARTGSSYPGNLALGTVDDTGLTRSVARAMGADLAAAGIDLDLAPVADVNSNPINPVIGVRAFGTRPGPVARQTAAWVAGLQEAGVAACVKHFPGHGDTSVDSHLALPVVDEDPHAGALEPFRAAIAAGVRAVMSAHILVRSIDSVPATISARIMTGLLRDELGFEGLAVSDGLEMRAIADGVGIAEGTVLALAAGCDLLCIGGGFAGEDIAITLRDAIVAAVREGRVSEARLAEAAARVERLAQWRSKQTATQSRDPAVGLVAARRAIRAEGSVKIDHNPVVVQLSSMPSQAAGVVPWGVAVPLTQLGARVTAIELDRPPASLDGILKEAAGRSLVLVVRDLHRHPWMATLTEAVLVQRADAVTVEMGLPACRPAGASAYIATHGAARVCGVAAAERMKAS